MPAAKKKLALKKSVKPTGASKKSAAKGKPAKAKSAKGRASSPKSKSKAPVSKKAPARKQAPKVAKKPVKKVSKPVKAAKKAIKASAKVVVRKAKAIVRNAKAAVRNAKKVASRFVAPAKTAAKKSVVAKTVAKIASKPAPKAVAKPAPARPVVGKPAAPVTGKPMASAPAIKPAAKPAAAPAKQRRPKLRIRPDTGPLAAWLPQPDAPRPRPSSFIPAPPRAENAFSVAAPPATSDRIVRPDDLLEIGKATIRTSPIRVDIEQSGGRTHVFPLPEFLTIRASEGLEWDFRYLGGADVIIEEVVIEFEKPGPFGKASFRSSRPGSARPHRQISGPASKESAGKTFDYTIRCFDLVKNEVAKAKLKLTVG